MVIYFVCYFIGSFEYGSLDITLWKEENRSMVSDSACILFILYWIYYKCTRSETNFDSNEDTYTKTEIANALSNYDEWTKKEILDKL